MIRSVAVVGGGVAGWSAAVALARRLGPRCAFVVVETGDEVHDPLALSTLPTSADFHARVGGDEAALLRAARGTYKLGLNCEGWSGDGSAYFEPFGGFGAPINGAAFHHAILRLQAEGRPVRLTDYSLGAAAARLGRFAHPSGDPRSVLSTLAYALHLDSAAYAGALRALAMQLGVERIESGVAGVETGAAERIEALRLADGRRIAADLYLDATGPAARLIGAALGEPFEDWSAALPFDSRVEVLRGASTAPAPFTTLAAEPDGWRTLVPLQGAVGETFTYARGALSDDAAAARLGRGEPRLTRLALGRRARAWVGNCLALGETAGAPGPGLSLHLAHSAVLRLLKLIPYRDGFEICAAEYNRLWAEEQERLRDFALLRFRVNGRAGEAGWDAALEAPAPESLDYRIDQFRSRGRAPLFEEEVFPEASWVAVLLGQGVRPERHDVRVDVMELPKLEDHLGRMRAAFAQGADAMPPHDAYLRRVGAAIAEGASA